MTNTEIKSFDPNSEEYLNWQLDNANNIAGKLTGYDCPKCKNRGTVFFIKDGEIVARDCECMSKRRTMGRIKGSGLELQLSEKRFDNFKTDTAFQGMMKRTAVEYLKEQGKWFLISGQSGCGKTHICTAIVGQLIKQGKDVIYIPYRDEIMKLKQNVTESEEYQPRINQLKNVAVLYIDDLFKGKVSEPDINLIYELIGYRYSNRLQTIVSTELLFDELMLKDQAIAGRIREMCGKDETGKSKYMIQVSRGDDKNFRMQ